MDLFFFRNRLSAWMDGELSTAECEVLESAMTAQPELRAEADAYRERVERLRGLRLEAPPEVMQAVLRTPRPSWRPGRGIVGAVAVLLAATVWWGTAPSGTPEPPETAPTADVAAPDVVAATPETAPETMPEPAVKPAPSVALVPKTPTHPYVPKNGRGHARMTVVIPKDIVEDPDATDYAEEDPLPTRAPVQSYRYRLVPSDPNTALKGLRDLVTHMGGQFLNPTGGAKATYPIESGSVERVLLKVSAANLPALVQNLPTVGTLSVVAQPDEVPPSGMVGVFVEIDVPPQ